MRSVDLMWWPDRHNLKNGLCNAAPDFFLHLDKVSQERNRRGQNHADIRFDSKNGSSGRTPFGFAQGKLTSDHLSGIVSFFATSLLSDAHVWLPNACLDTPQNKAG